MRIATDMYRDKLRVLEYLYSLDQVRTLTSHAKGVGEDDGAGDPASAQSRDKMAGTDRFVKNLLERRGPVKLKANFLTTVFAQRVAGTVFEFHLSDKFEPYAIIIAFDPDSDNLLVQLSTRQLDGLDKARRDFMQRYKLPDMGYHYTPLQERLETDRFVAENSVARSSKAHSTVFHLKMRVPDAFYRSHLPALQAARAAELSGLDPVVYNYSRPVATWDETEAALRRDALG
mmetsp:Transcript_66535/g.178045  ORF Transcript_66535/g.178045 Transcript_66535/m.178045 type:complete len:231 (+) Transcript_66535:1-693(+)